MTTITAHEQRDIDRANASGLQPIVFVHGLWLLSSSWGRWRSLAEEQGYITIAPGWPDDPDTVEEAKEEPEVFAHKRLEAGLPVTATRYLGAIHDFVLLNPIAQSLSTRAALAQATAALRAAFAR